MRRFLATIVLAAFSCSGGQSPDGSSFAHHTALRFQQTALRLQMEYFDRRIQQHQLERYRPEYHDRQPVPWELAGREQDGTDGRP